jgi:hypothetical protein
VDKRRRIDPIIERVQQLTALRQIAADLAAAAGSVERALGYFDAVR